MGQKVSSYLRATHTKHEQQAYETKRVQILNPYTQKDEQEHSTIRKTVAQMRSTLRKLNHEYLGTSDFYYDETTNIIYSIPSSGDSYSQVSIQTSNELRKINGISAPPSEQPDGPWDGVDETNSTNYNASYEEKYNKLQEDVRKHEEDVLGDTT